MKMGDRIERIIRKHRTNPNRVARAAGVSPGVVYKLMAGQDNVLVCNLAAVAAALGVAPGYLLDGSWWERLWRRERRATGAVAAEPPEPVQYALTEREEA